MKDKYLEQIKELKRELRFTKIELDVQRNHLERISSLYTTLTSTLDLTHVLDLLLENMSDLVNYDTAFVYRKKNDEFIRVTSRRNMEMFFDENYDITEKDMTGEKCVNFQALIDKVEKTKEVFLIPVIDYELHSSFVAKNTIVKSIMVIPIINLGKVVATIIMISSINEAFIKEVGMLAQILANQSGVAIENANLFEEVEEKKKKIENLNNRLANRNLELEVLVEERTEKLQKMTISLVTSLENANLYNDENTGKHIVRVAAYAESIAKIKKLDLNMIREIKLYAPLHDIGKVGIPDTLLKKPGKYSNEEFEQIKVHVDIGYKMIKDAPISEIAKNIIRYHHEKFDGRGYLNGLKGENIPIEARIVSIADVFDALTTRRPYKEPFSVEKAIAIMTEGRGTQFDPELLDIFLENMPLMLAIREKNKDE